VATKYSIREAIQLDLATLVGMEKKLFSDSPWSMGQFKEEFKGVPKSRYFLVAVDGENQIIGYAGVLVVAPGVEADVLTVGVLPNHQKMGIATAFMSELEKWSATKGAPAMMLEVAIENTPAITLYEKLGYEKISTRQNYYGPALDALVMRKELAL
jgi:[ribosomal protein S18]-alanine N-acetyltransferase